MKNDEKQVAEIIGGLFPDKKIEMCARMGGLTNRTYCIKTDMGNYAVRLPGVGTEEIINRLDEKESTMLACDLGIDSKLYYFDSDTGIKVMQYIDNSITMNAEKLRQDDSIIKVANVLKKLHTCQKDTKVQFDVIKMAETYEEYIVKNNGFFYDDYEEVKEYINKIRNEYLVNVNRVPCHNDPLCENWILQNNGKMYLIDWEYAGMNDPMWDLADVSIEADYTDEMNMLLLTSYFDRVPTKLEEAAFKINKVLIDYLWSLWGKTSAVNNGEEMEEYAKIRYERMKKNMTYLG